MTLVDDDHSNYEMIRKDAEDNYDNGRLRDAYRHFSSLTEKMLADDMVEEALYFGYRSLLCLTEPEYHYDYLRELAKLGLNLLMKVLKETSSIIATDTDPHIRIDFGQLQAQLLKQMSNPIQLQQTNAQLIDDYELISKEHDLIVTEKIHILEKLIVLNEEISEEGDSHSYKGRLAQLYIQEADDLTEDEINIYQKIHLYEEALKLLASKNPLYQRIAKKMKRLKMDIA